jgi:hypothetical protein
MKIYVTRISMEHLDLLTKAGYSIILIETKKGVIK